MSQVINIAGYQFRDIRDVEHIHKQIQDMCAQTHLRGTVFVSQEGVNLGLAGSKSDIDFVVKGLASKCGFTDLLLNITYSEHVPFKKLIIKIRKELVPMNISKIIPKDLDSTPSYISSEELKNWFEEGKNFTLLDLRNTFEYDLGSFDGAQHLKLRNFRGLQDVQNKISKIPNNKPIVTFCTGGIRCEKGASIISQLGFTEVYQLKGGILDYLKKFNEFHWHGECFVFDDRVSLDHELNPSYARLCKTCQKLLTDKEETFCENCMELS